MNEINEKLGAWHRILLGEANGIVHRLTVATPTKLFYNDLADSLELLVVRIRREIKD